MTPRPPNTLTPDSRRLWTRIVKGCIISEPELEVLRLCLESRDEMIDLRAKIQKFGVVIKGKNGDLKPNPLYRPLREARGNFLKAWRTLGFKPEKPARGPGRPVPTVSYDFSEGD